MSSVLGLLRQRLPDLTLKKFAEVTGFKYTNSKDGKAKAKCTKKELSCFITGDMKC